MGARFGYVQKQELLLWLCQNGHYFSIGGAALAVFKNAYVIGITDLYCQTAIDIICKIGDRIESRPDEAKLRQKAEEVLRNMFIAGVIRQTMPAWYALSKKTIICHEVIKMRTPEIKEKYKEMQLRTRTKKQVVKTKEKQNNTAKRPYVYYVSWGLNLDHVKIGYSVNLVDRFKTFLTGSPDTLHVWRIQPVCGPEDEKRLHERFREHRLVGEWFKMEGDLKAYIGDLPINEALNMQNNFDSRVLIHCF